MGYQKKRNVTALVSRLQDRVNSKHAFSKTELKKLASDPLLRSHKIFHDQNGVDSLPKLLTQAKAKEDKKYIEQVESNKVIAKNELAKMSRMRPDLALEYLGKHGNGNVQMHKLYPAIWNLNYHQWQEIKNLSALYAVQEANGKTVELMKKAIHMKDDKLYNHLKQTCGIDLLDKNNKWYEPHSSKHIRKAIGRM